MGIVILEFQDWGQQLIMMNLAEEEDRKYMQSRHHSPPSTGKICPVMYVFRQRYMQADAISWDA